MSEKMTFVRGKDCSYWLIGHKHNSPDYLAYKIDETGIHPAVKSTTGLTPVRNFWGGEIKASPDGTKLVITGNKTSPSQSAIELSSFDPATGVVSNTAILDTVPNITRYGYSFSPDNTKLYVSNSLPSFFTTYGTITQLDISLMPNIAAVNSSKYEVIRSQKNYAGMRVGPDNKIYIAISNSPFIARINQPDQAGVSCGIDSLALLQPAGTSFPVTAVLYGYGLGNGVLSIVPDTLPRTVKDTLICLDNPAPIQADSGYSLYSWDDGSTERTRIINGAGKYWVVYGRDICYRYVDTFTVGNYQLDPVVAVNGFELSTSALYAGYQWLRNGITLTGATENVYTVTENGDYAVVVTNEKGCRDTSEYYTVNNVSVTRINTEGSLIHLYPNPAGNILYIDAPIAVSVLIMDIEGRNIIKSNSSRRLAIGTLTPGVYVVHITDGDGHLLKTAKFVKQ